MIHSPLIASHRGHLVVCSMQRCLCADLECDLIFYKLCMLIWENQLRIILVPLTSCLFSMDKILGLLNVRNKAELERSIVLTIWVFLGSDFIYGFINFLSNFIFNSPWVFCFGVIGVFSSWFYCFFLNLLIDEAFRQGKILDCLN